jgi:hypothetical protein
MEHLTHSFRVLLFSFQPVFTKPSFHLFMSLMTGWILSVRHRYITELIFSSDNVGTGHWSRFHRFFSKNAWSLDELCLVLARLLFALFAPEGAILLALDDTLCRKRGLNLFGAGMHHDPLLSSKAVKLVSWGHDWVVLGFVLRCPFWASSKVFCLPIAFRLYRNRQGNRKGQPPEADTRSRSPKKHQKNQKPRATKKRPASPPSEHRTRPELGLELIGLLAAAFPERQFTVAADSLYGGRSVLSQLPANVGLISRVHPKGALYESAPLQPAGKRGRKPTKGKRLPAMAEWANDASPWTAVAFDQFGLHAQLSVKRRQGLYYKAGKGRLLTFVLVRDDKGKRPLQIFYCSRLDWTAEQILSAYACRWSIEVAFENGKQMLGFEDPANRVPKAVLRTAPMALVLVSLITLWFHQEGHRHVRFPYRPWYRKKREPSFGDMLSTLRRLSWSELIAQALAPRGCQKTLQTLLARLTEFISRPG